MIQRKNYLNQLELFKDKQLIKVITGVRRCGKSTLFQLYQECLLKSGVKKEQIQSLNFEDVLNAELLDYKKLHKYILEHAISNQQNYIFLDEIQNVPQFQKVVDSLYIRNNFDIYITGSNAQLLSGELTTLLSGRYVEIQMMPLSFMLLPNRTKAIYPNCTHLTYRMGPFHIHCKCQQKKPKIFI